MHTIEIDGRPVAIMAGSRDEVEDFASEPAFRGDMLALEDQERRPLWSGKGKFTPFVRESFPEEIAVFERGFAKARADGEEPDRESWLVLLVSVVDPTDYMDDEDESA